MAPDSSKTAKKKPMPAHVGLQKDIAILGGGLAGLSSCRVLTKSGFKVSVYEADQAIGGLSKTIEKNGYRFDLGGHRFFTKDKKIESFVREIMGQELITVRRSSKIYMLDKYFDYPLKPLNAIFGLGLRTTVKILADYISQSARSMREKKDIVSLEDWVVNKFGRTMFNIYFKEYSEKVWGIACGNICATWVAQRIRGLSLAKAVKNALFKLSGNVLPTLTDHFLYPSLGIGRLSERLKDEIEKNNTVFTGTPVVSINRTGFAVESITVQNQGARRTVPIDEIISTIPINKLIVMLNPSPPLHIIRTAGRLKFRDLIIVAIMLDREQVTDQTWIYIPEKKIPFGRIHEPTNWSRAMAPPGKSVLVAEFFSFRDDAIWRSPDSDLTRLTVDNLVKLGFIHESDVVDSAVVRVPNAYPLFETGYRRYLAELYDYVNAFDNLHIAGRSGMFEYYNMDVALRSGMETAGKVIEKFRSADQVDPGKLVPAAQTLTETGRMQEASLAKHAKVLSREMF